MVDLLGYLNNVSSTLGYQLLQKNLPTAVNNFQNQTTTQSAITYFEQNASKVTSVDQFVNDPKLLDFVLSAFDLDSEAQYPGLIKAVLTQDPNNSNSLVNQLTDPRFKQLATALDFYDDGLSKLQGLDAPQPTTATKTEPGVTATDTSPNYKASTAISVGIGVSGNGYLQLQTSAGNTVYAKSAYFTVNSSGQLALPDGTTLVPGYTVPAGTTALTVDTKGDLYAQVAGKATLLGAIQLTNFGNPSALKTDKNGYTIATTAAGTPTVGTPTDPRLDLGSTVSFGNTYQDLVNNYITNEFEASVGQDNTAVEEALYFQRNAGSEIDATGAGAQKTNADTILGDSVLRNVVLTAIGQPATIAEQSLSTQEGLVEVGTNGIDFQNTQQVTNFVQRYLSTVDLTSSSSSSASTSTNPSVELLTSFAGGSSDGSSLLSTENTANSNILKLLA